MSPRTPPKFHKPHGRLITLAEVRPPARFAGVSRPAKGGSKAFFVRGSQVFDRIENDSIQFEKQPLQRLVRVGQPMAYRHHSL